MELIHTSPTEITSIDKHGRFGEFLFFSDSEYVMTAGEYISYKLMVADGEIIEAGRLFFHEGAASLGALVSELAELLDVSEADAEALIEESTSIYDLTSNVEAEDLAEASWNIQRFTARAAQRLGFRGVAVTDEQGTAYMIDMLGREGDLVKV